MSTAGPIGERPDLKEILRHRDPSQLWFQLAEIIGDRTYLRHDIEVHPGDVVIDAGANVGVAAAFFLSECGAAEVHSFEPVPAIFEMLAENMARFPGSHIYLAGLSDREESVEFTYYEGAAAMSSRYAIPERDHELVKTVLIGTGLSEIEAEARIVGDFRPDTVSCNLRPLSAMIEEEGIGRVDLLKIDVERAELDVLRGIRGEHWPMVRQVVVEAHDEGARLIEVRGLLESHGFTVVLDQEANMKGTGVFVVYAKRD